MTPDRIAARPRLRSSAIRRPRAMVEDMNRAMAWNIAGVGRRTRDPAVEAARRSGMRLDDWLDEAIADYVGLDQSVRPEHNEAGDDRLDAAAGRLERIAGRKASAQAPPPPRIPGSFNSVIERFEMRLPRAPQEPRPPLETAAHT